MTRKIVGLALSSVLAFSAVPALADQPVAGENELAGRLNYTDIDYGSGSVTNTEFTLAWGRYLTPNHQVGLNASYIDQEIEDDFGDSLSADGSTLGVFYAFHFGTAGMTTPYIGVNAAIISGDLGDLYDYSYGLEAGLKVFPYKNAGFVFSVSYAELSAAESFIEDADGINVGAGLLIRF